MRLLELLEADLYELNMRWKSPDIKDEVFLIAFRGSYWIVPAPYDHVDIPDAVMQDISKTTGMPLPTSYSSGIEHFSEFSESRPDIIFGYIRDNELDTIDVGSARQHPVTSGMLKKLVAELGLRGVNLQSHGDDDTVGYFNKYQMTGNLPTSLFHGTSNENFEMITRVGLRPDRRESNWASMGVSHPELIFGTADQSGAEFHANKSAGTHSGNEEVYGDPDEPFPVVFEFKIPDQNLIVPDYDVASAIIGHNTQTDDLGYTNQSGGYAEYSNSDDVVAANPEGRAWKSAGIFGYRGWIPPNYIIQVHTPFFDGPFGETRLWSGKPSEYADALSQERNNHGYDEDEEEHEDWL